MAPWLLDAAMPTRLSAGCSTSATLRKVRVPVTTTSALNARGRTALAMTGSAATATLRRSTVKLIKR